MNLRDVDKRMLLTQLIEIVDREVAQVQAAQRAAMDGATHEESRPENDKDTRALESSYLARGQARRVGELQEVRAVLSSLEPRRFDSAHAVQSTALVALRAEEGEIEYYWLLPTAGGFQLSAGELVVTTVTLGAPLGRHLVGKDCGEAFEVQLPQGPREYVVEDVA